MVSCSHLIKDKPPYFQATLSKGYMECQVAIAGNEKQKVLLKAGITSYTLWRSLTIKLNQPLNPCNLPPGEWRQGSHGPHLMS